MKFVRLFIGRIEVNSPGISFKNIAKLADFKTEYYPIRSVAVLLMHLPKGQSSHTTS